MKIPSLLLLAAVLLLPAFSAPAADETAKPDAKAELDALVGRINTKLQSGAARTEQEFSGELKEFDAIVERHGKDAKADLLAEALLMKGALYLQVLQQPEKAEAIFRTLEETYPETAPGKSAKAMLAGIQRQIDAAKIQAGLEVGKPFPPFAVKDLAGKPLSLEALKGKVVLVDFWATWCPPCVAEVPEVLATYKANHDKGFEIVGVSLDEDRGQLEAFIGQRGMTWPQYFDGKGFDNALAAKYGITAIPATFLLDGNGVIIGRDLRGSELGEAVAKAVKK